jgi:uncharacterized protein YyaL (SSP411 family)
MTDYLAEARKALQEARAIKEQQVVDALVREAQQLITALTEAYRFTDKPISIGEGHGRFIVDD